jgi:lipopolysaccharide transport system ATP-binding protein
VLLDRGQVQQVGECASVVTSYLRSLVDSSKEGDLAACRVAGMTPVIHHVEVLDPEGHPTGFLRSGSAATIRIHYDSPVPMLQPVFEILFESILGDRLFSLNTRLQQGDLNQLPSRGVAECRVPEISLAPGTYYLTFHCRAHRRDTPDDRNLDVLERAVMLTFESVDFYGTGKFPRSDRTQFLVRASWSFPGAPVDLSEKLGAAGQPDRE